MKAKFNQFKDFLMKNEQNIVLLVGFFLISGISFCFGLLQGQKMTSKPLVIEKPMEIPQTSEVVQMGPKESAEGAASVAAKASVTAASGAGTQTCAFVGSKNSDKFYAPTCSYAKRVKPENLVCYNSEAEALQKGKIKSDCK